MKLLSIFGLKQRSAVELAADKHARTIKEAPTKLRSALDKDIEFLQRVIEAIGIESAAERIDSEPVELDGGPIAKNSDLLEPEAVSTQHDLESSIDTQAQTIANDLDYDLKSVPTVLLYSESRLGTLLLAAANYQLWLKQQYKRKESPQCYELMLYLSNRSNGDLMSFPLHASKLVQDIRGADNPHMMMFYHSLLLNSLIELRKELL